jgi:hypothetical protein
MLTFALENSQMKKRYTEEQIIAVLQEAERSGRRDSRGCSIESGSTTTRITRGAPRLRCKAYVCGFYNGMVTIWTLRINAFW